jgi:hypothetical protein
MSAYRYHLAAPGEDKSTWHTSCPHSVVWLVGHDWRLVLTDEDVAECDCPPSCGRKSRRLSS